ncbi:hypothetical protein GCM10022222_42290 [Amycolatopsis ultiminotia]|uniref:PPE family protein n=1 Tax=Amycolatopsis ultiminotia TaxID=543629 RepID=A0ABP6WPQ6_9PSEU
MGFFDWVGDGTKWLNDRFNDAEQWVEDAWHGNLGDQAVPAPELVQKILASKGAQSWHQGAEQATKLAGKHDDAGSRVQQLSAGLESAWSGGGADAAQARIKPFSDVTTAAAQTYTGNGQNLTDTAHGFDEMKKALQPMPNTPPHKNFWDEASWWDTDTEDQINQYNKLAQDNLNHYHGYAQQTQTSGQGLKADYGQLTGFDGDVSVTPQDSATSHSAHTSTGGTNGHSSPRSDSVGTPYTATPPSSSPVSTGPSPGSHYVPPGTTTPGQDGQSGGGTQTAGYVPPSLPDPRPGSVPLPSMPGSSSGTGGGSSWSPGLAGGFTTGGFGPGGSPGTGGGAAGRGLSGGARSGGSGIGSGSGIGAGEEGTARGSAAGRGATGARGSSGMGGMGAAGGKGKSEEDAEHQRKYGMDDDSAFSLTDDDGGRLLDPRTGLPPTPPTIGG